MSQNTLLALLPLIGLLACTATPGDKDDTSAPVDTADTSAPVDTADTSSPTDSGDTSEPVDSADSAERTYNYVLTSLTVADRGEGFDLDGDGTADNAVALFGSVLDPVFASAMDGASRVLVLQVADAESLSEDASVQIALISASDPDGDPSDNADGETFSGGPAVDADGRAVGGVETGLSGGGYTVALLEGTLVIGSLELQSATPIWVGGDVTAEAHGGLIGFGIGTDALVLALQTAGYTEQADLVVTLADLDTDDDGEADAISLAFAFDAVACGLAP